MSAPLLPQRVREHLAAHLAAIIAGLAVAAGILGAPAALAAVPDAAAGAPAVPRSCLFMAGVSYGPVGDGRTSPLRGTLDTAPYWGDMAYALAGRCSEVLYSHFPNADWTSAATQRGYYDAAQRTYSGGGVVFAHGIANNALAAACAQQGLCGVRWYALSPMLDGNSMADTAKNLGGLVSGAQKAIPYSDSTPYSVSMAKMTNPRLGLGATAVAKGLLKGVACGTDPFGSGGATGLLLFGNSAAVFGVSIPTKWWFQIPIAWAPVRSDGMNQFDRCSQYTISTGNGWAVSRLGSFNSASDSPYFSPAANFWDLTGSRGNTAGILDWMRAMVARD